MPGDSQRYRLASKNGWLRSFCKPERDGILRRFILKQVSVIYWLRPGPGGLLDGGPAGDIIYPLRKGG